MLDKELARLVCCSHQNSKMNLEEFFFANQIRIESWLLSQFKNCPTPFYASVDLRNSGFKIAPVDTNLFPQGFNNLSFNTYNLAINAIQNAIGNDCPVTSGVLVVAENHTRNLKYFENLAVIKRLLESAGYKVRITNFVIQDTMHIEKYNIVIEPMKRQDLRIGVKDFYPCAILLNNDMSDIKPRILDDIEQVVLPNPELGWYKRFKSKHFEFYSDIIANFAEEFSIDPWLLDSYFDYIHNLDLNNEQSLLIAQNKVQQLLDKIQQKYDYYGIKQKPFVMLKADSGTYGMSVIPIENAKQIMNLNRKQRKNISYTKGGKQEINLIFQEGVYSHEIISHTANGNKEMISSVAEPVVYLIHRNVIGGFYRLNQNKSATDNLNSPGMEFKKISFDSPGVTIDKEKEPSDSLNKKYIYGVMARLATLAAAKENCWLLKKNKNSTQLK